MRRLTMVVVLGAVAALLLHAESSGKTVQEWLREWGLTAETHDQAIALCKQAVKAEFLDSVDVRFMSFPGTARSPDGTLRLYADVSTPWRLLGWRCVLSKDIKTVKSVTVIPFCGAVGNALNDRSQVLKRPTTRCVSNHEELR